MVRWPPTRQGSQGCGGTDETHRTKDPASPYRPGGRSPAWLKLEPKLTLEVVVTGGSAKGIACGDWVRS